MEISDNIGSLYAGTPVVKGYGSDFHCGVVVGTNCVGPGEHDREAVVLFESDEFYGAGTATNVLSTTKNFAAIALPITELVATSGYRQTTLSTLTNVPTTVKRRLAAQGDLFMEQRFSHCSKCNQLVDTGGVQGLDAHEAECAKRGAAISLVTLRLSREGNRAPGVPVKVSDRITMIANCLDQLDVAIKLQRFKQVGAPTRRPSWRPAAFFVNAALSMC